MASLQITIFPLIFRFYVRLCVVVIFYNRVYILLNKIIGGIHMKYRHKKQDRIELRVSDQQKAQIKSNANSLGLSLSKYILKMAEDGQIITIDSKNRCS